MVNKNVAKFLDKISLVIIGTGASLFYYYLDKSVASGQSLGSFVTIALILIIRSAPSAAASLDDIDNQCIYPIADQ